MGQYRDILRQNGERCDQIIEERLNSKEEQLLYGNDLMRQIDEEEKLLNAAKRDKKDYLDYLKESIRAENFRTAEELEKAQKKHDELSERVTRLEEEVKNLPDAEAPDVFNPFSMGGNKRQKEQELVHAKEELEETRKEIEILREAADQWAGKEAMMKAKEHKLHTLQQQVTE